MTNQTPPTYRDILTPLFGADALAEAERRVYTPVWLSETATLHHACADGLCALAVAARAAGLELLRQEFDYDPRFPPVGALIDDIDGLAADALDEIIVANDRGELATPGALTALLDTPLDTPLAAATRGDDR